MCASSTGVRLGRRALLSASGAAVVTALAACTTNRPGADGPPSSTPARSPTAVPGPSQTSTPEPSASDQIGFEQVDEALQEESPQEWGLEATGVVSSFATAENRAVLSLDACGGPNGSGYDEQLIEALRVSSTPATVFINQRWAEANRSITEELVNDPLFEIASHGTRHLPLSVSGQSAYGVAGTSTLREAYAELTENREYFRDTYSLDLRYFRSGTAHTDEVSVQMAGMLGVDVVNFSLNADAGATYPADKVHQALAQVQPGDICIGHFNKPGSGTAQGVAAALEVAAARGIEWTTLETALTPS